MRRVHNLYGLVNDGAEGGGGKQVNWVAKEWTGVPSFLCCVTLFFGRGEGEGEPLVHLLRGVKCVQMPIFGQVKKGELF